MKTQTVWCLEYKGRLLTSTVRTTARDAMLSGVAPILIDIGGEGRAIQSFRRLGIRPVRVTVRRHHAKT